MYPFIDIVKSGGHWPDRIRIIQSRFGGSRPDNGYIKKMMIRFYVMVEQDFSATGYPAQP